MCDETPEIGVSGNDMVMCCSTVRVVVHLFSAGKHRKIEIIIVVESGCQHHVSAAMMCWSSVIREPFMYPNLGSDSARSGSTLMERNIVGVAQFCSSKG